MQVEKYMREQHQILSIVSMFGMLLKVTTP